MTAARRRAARAYKTRGSRIDVILRLPEDRAAWALLRVSAATRGVPLAEAVGEAVRLAVAPGRVRFNPETSPVD